MSLAYCLFQSFLCTAYYYSDSMDICYFPHGASQAQFGIGGLSSRLKRLWDERNMPASIAVLVRTKNELAALPDFWRSLVKQSIFENAEIIFLDSGSSDGTVEYLLGKPCAVYSIPPE